MAGVDDSLNRGVSSRFLHAMKHPSADNNNSENEKSGIATEIENLLSIYLNLEQKIPSVFVQQNFLR